MKRYLVVMLLPLGLTACGEKAPQMTCAQMIAEVARVEPLLDRGEARVMSFMGTSRPSNDEMCAIARANVKLADDYARLYKANKDQCTELSYQMTIRGGLNIDAPLSREAFKQGLCK
jgi:hypothetical protein